MRWQQATTKASAMLTSYPRCLVYSQVPGDVLACEGMDGTAHSFSYSELETLRLSVTLDDMSLHMIWADSSRIIVRGRVPDLYLIRQCVRDFKARRICTMPETAEEFHALSLYGLVLELSPARAHQLSAVSLSPSEKCAV